MVIYEITALVSAELVGEYEKFMREKHIPDLLATGFFRGAELSSSAAGHYRIRYEAHDQTALDEYLNRRAARLRADFAAHFPAGVTVSRENWEVLQSWKVSNPL